MSARRPVHAYRARCAKTVLLGAIIVACTREQQSSPIETTAASPTAEQTPPTPEPPWWKSAERAGAKLTAAGAILPSASRGLPLRPSARQLLISESGVTIGDLAPIPLWPQRPAEPVSPLGVHLKQLRAIDSAPVAADVWADRKLTMPSLHALLLGAVEAGHTDLSLVAATTGAAFARLPFRADSSVPDAPAVHVFLEEGSVRLRWYSDAGRAKSQAADAKPPTPTTRAIRVSTFVQEAPTLWGPEGPLRRDGELAYRDAVLHLSRKATVEDFARLLSAFIGAGASAPDAKSVPTPTLLLRWHPPTRHVKFGDFKIESSIPNIEEPVPRRAIERALELRTDAMEDCYSSALEYDPRLSGRLDLRFMITRQGTPADPHVRNDFGDEQVRRCVAKTMLSANFPPSSGGFVIVDVPLVFEP